MTTAWPMNDREWARGAVPVESPLRGQIGCNVTTCPNGKCRAIGECINLEAQRAEQARQNRG
jgi:hypothetical protein